MIKALTLTNVLSLAFLFWFTVKHKSKSQQWEQLQEFWEALKKHFWWQMSQNKRGVWSRFMSQKIHSLKLIFKPFKALFETFIFKGYGWVQALTACRLSGPLSMRVLSKKIFTSIFDQRSPMVFCNKRGGGQSRCDIVTKNMFFKASLKATHL